MRCGVLFVCIFRMLELCIFVACGRHHHNVLCRQCVHKDLELSWKSCCQSLELLMFAQLICLGNSSTSSHVKLSENREWQASFKSCWEVRPWSVPTLNYAPNALNEHLCIVVVLAGVSLSPLCQLDLFLELGYHPAHNMANVCSIGTTPDKKYH